MKTSILLATLLCLSCTHKAEAKKCGKAPIKIAVIDSGFGFNDLGHTANLCKYGHKDFTSDRQFTHSYDTETLVPLDTNGHGTNIVGIIDEYAKAAHVNYCIVIIKYWSPQQTGKQNLLGSIRSIIYAKNIKADYINFSGGGPNRDVVENAAVKSFLNHKGVFVAAAGNENENLDNPENTYYPAEYDKRIIVVGNLSKDGVRSKLSNYGSAVTRWEVGENVEVYGITMTGTSQATAVATGKIVSESDNKCDIGF